MKIKHYLYAILVFLKCGSFFPKVMKTPVTNQSISMNPQDDRAYKKIVIDFIRKRESTPMRFWRDHVGRLGKTLCMDIGANYGECFANVEYADAEIIAIEANPLLIPYLEETRSLHKDKNKIHIANVLVSDKVENNIDFHYSEKWSGGGSAAVKGNNSKVISLSSKPLNDIVYDLGCSGYASLLFKIDVEGFEGRALIPFLEKANYNKVIGIAEFDTLMLKAAGTDPESFFDLLAHRFHVFLTRRRSLNLVRLMDWSDLSGSFKSSEFHCDLAVYSDESLIADGWKVIR